MYIYLSLSLPIFLYLSLSPSHKLLIPRFMPDTLLMKAYPITEYTPHCVTTAGAAVILMIMNNLDRRVAQFPEELVTYGGNGQVRRGRGKSSLVGVCVRV